MIDELGEYSLPKGAEKFKILDSVSKAHGLMPPEANWIWNQMTWLFTQEKEQVIGNPEDIESIVAKWIEANGAMIDRALGKGIFPKANIDKLEAIKMMWLELCVYIVGNKDTGVESPGKKIKFDIQTTGSGLFPKTEMRVSEKIEEKLKLPHKDLSYLRQIMAQQSSGGSACVPIVYAYLMMIKYDLTDYGAQETLLGQILDKWRREDGGNWVVPNKYTDRRDIREIAHFENVYMKQVTEIIQLNKLITFLMARGNEGFVDMYGQFRKVSRDNATAIIFTTAVSLPAKVVYSCPENPYWRRVEDQGIYPPSAGEHITTAASHALLAVDYLKDGNSYKIYALDPQTGNILLYRY